MNKSFFLRNFVFAALALLAGNKAAAQFHYLQKGELLPVPKVTPAEQARLQNKVEADYPFLFKYSKRLPSLGTKELTVTPVLRVQSQAVARPPRVATRPATLYAYLSYVNGWTADDNECGVYRFSATAPNVLDSIKLGTFELNGGVGIYDGVIYGIAFNKDYAAYNILIENIYTIDPETKEITYDVLDDPTLAALETAQASDGTVYGQFYADPTFSNFVWGTIDYRTLQRTTFGTVSHPAVALGIDSNDNLYSIAADGNLYKVDKTTGAETLVGATGLDLDGGTGSAYLQTGEIDQKTNTFYWCAVDNDANTGFYTVDLQTGAATKVADYNPPSQFYGLMVPAPEAEDGAPAIATNVSASFPNGSLSGTVAFTAPTTTYAGEALTGSLDYYIVEGRDTLMRGNTSAGADETANLTLSSEGIHNLSVVTRNAVGLSPRARTELYVGYDYPLAPTDLTLNVNKEAGSTSLTWTAPTAGRNKGYLGELKYNVYRVNGAQNELVGSGLSATSFSETIPVDGLVLYRYKVCAVNNGHEGDGALSQSFTVGTAYEIPWFEDFLSADAFGMFTVNDANGDGNTWEWTNSDYRHAARYVGGSNDGDDWLFTSPIHLKTDRDYHFGMRASAYSADTPERFEVKLGEQASAAGMTTTVIPATAIQSQTNLRFSNDAVRVAKEGNYYLGLHALSKAGDYYLYVDSLEMTTAVLHSAPDSVTNLKATPDSKGAQQVTLTFNAPTTTAGGAALTSISYINILRNDTLWTTLRSIGPGEACSFTDNVDVSGVYRYSVVAYNDNGNGRPRYITPYVGLDWPDYPRVRTVVDNKTTLNLRWQQSGSTGYNGGVVVPEDVVYTLRGFTSDGALGDTIASVKATDHYTQAISDADAGDMRLARYAVNASNAAGPSLYAGIYHVLGKPYGLPYTESFKNGKLTNFGYFGKNHTDISFAKDAVDGDGGALKIQSYLSNAAASYTSGKINLQGASNPAITFSAKSLTGTNTLVLTVLTPEGACDTLLTNTLSQDWTTLKADLSKYTSERYIVVEAIVNLPQYRNAVLMDNIRVANFLDHNLTAGLEIPATMRKGEPTPTAITVSNNGLNTAAGYTVRLKIDDKVLNEATTNRLLAPQQSDTISFKTSVPVYCGAYATLTAEVVYDQDMDQTDNSVSQTIPLTDPVVAGPRNVTIDETPTLQWEAPESSEATITEDFESYTPWATAFGDWTLYDNDGGVAGPLFTGHRYGAQDEQFAFTIFNPEDIYSGATTDDPTLAAHSGAQYAAAVQQLNAAGDNYVAADNYLVSPQLSGKEQTVTFWAKNGMGVYAAYVHEKFDFLTSTTGNAVADFTVLQAGNEVTTGEWTQFSFTLPAGTRYFAIHQNTSALDCYLFALDDITYSVGSGSPVSYNIYRFHDTVGNTAETTFTDATAPNNTQLTYGVTAVYADGSESAPVYVTTTTDLRSLTIDGKKVDVYNVGGVKVGNNETTLPHGVYIREGKKILK